MSNPRPKDKKELMSVFKHFHASELPRRTASRKSSEESHSRSGQTGKHTSHEAPSSPLTALDEEHLEMMVKSLLLDSIDRSSFLRLFPDRTVAAITPGPPSSKRASVSEEQASEIESSPIHSPRSSTFSLNFQPKSYRNTFGLYYEDNETLPISGNPEWRQRWLLSQWRETYELQAEDILETIPPSVTDNRNCLPKNRNSDIPFLSLKEYGTPYFLWYWIPEEGSGTWRRYGIKIRRRHPHCVLSHHPSIISILELHCVNLEAFLYLDPFSREWSRIEPDDPMKISNSGHVLIRLECYQDVDYEGLKETIETAFGHTP